MMTTDLSDAKRWVREGRLEEAVGWLTHYIETHCECDDEPYYLLGNAYRKQGDWQQALNHYLEAIERNPQSPAVNARSMVMDILEFYNKDMYNQ